MSLEDLNIYQSARKVAGFTQERAAELLGISVESIRAYESGKRIPENGVVGRMVHVYDCQFLATQHVTQSDLGKKIFPEIKDIPLTNAALQYAKYTNDAAQIRDQLIAIAADGVIDDSEIAEYGELVRELRVLIPIILVLDAKGREKGIL